MHRLTTAPRLYSIFSLVTKTIVTPTSIRLKSTNPTNKGEEEWNDAWESAWLPENLSSKNRAPWELDVNFPTSAPSTVLLPSDVDTETKAFVEDMTENWNERRGKSVKTNMKEEELKKKESQNSSLYSVENMKKDYRMKKQRIHAGLWMKEIEKQEEAKLGGGGDDDIEKLLDSCSEIFEATNNEVDDSKVPTTSEFRTKPDGWETTSKSQEGNAWEISQREEDILLQEFERRIAYSKFQVPPVDVMGALTNKFFNGPLTSKCQWIVDHLPGAIMWVVWNERNRKIFQHKTKAPHAIIIEIKETLYDWSRGNVSFHETSFGDFMRNWSNVIL